MDGQHLVALPVRVTLGSLDAQVLYAGNAPGFVGLTQINVLVPHLSDACGAVEVGLQVGAFPATAMGETVAVSP